MADFSATLNTVMMLSFVFELGVVTSYLRYNQLYSATKYINAFIQLSIFLLIIIISQTLLGDYLDQFFGMHNIDISKGLVYFSAFAILNWVFFKNIFLSNKKIKVILFNAIFLTSVRVLLLGYILISSTKFSINDIYLYLFVIPFIVIISFNLKHDLSKIKESFSFLSNKTHLKIFAKRAKDIVKFSITTYIISILYVYTTRYALIYLTKENATELIAELGYAMSFGGVILIFSVSIRSFLISRFNISDTKAIKEYITKMKSYGVKFIVFSLLFSMMLGCIVCEIRPDYMSARVGVFTAILVESYLLSAYLGLFSLLSKTFNFNNLELRLNIIRLVLVLIVVKLFLLKYPIFGFFALNFAIVAVAAYFAWVVLNRVAKKV
jgi:hypothetical protein